MLRAMPCAITVLALYATAGPADEAKQKNRGTTDPKGVHLHLKVVAKKDTYALDLGGKTPEEFAKLLAEAEKTSSFPPAPAVDLVVELRNTGDKALRVWIGGDDSELVLHVTGKAARNLTARLGIGKKHQGPQIVNLPAGKTHDFPLRRLSTASYFSRLEVVRHSYWTKPGEYTLTASYHTAVSPAPKKAKGAGNGFGHVTVKSAPVKLKVVEKK
jgi:hypothetical protein